MISPGGLIATLVNSAAQVSRSVDVYFNYVSLLLNAESASTVSNNNTFIDSSANNFAITRNGTPTQGTFVPFNQSGWSGLFNGTSNYLSTPDSVALQPGSGDFTIEFWVYRTSTTSLQAALYQGAGGTNFQFRWGILWNGTTWVYMLSNAGAAADIANQVSMGTDPGIGKWVHLALVRNGSTFTPYINGVPGTTTTSALALNSYGNPVLTIGNALTSLNFFGGYISNVRIVKGTAIYTSAFTPSASQLAAVAGTSLLTLQDNQIKDNSTNAAVITTVGATVQAASPFVPTASWSAATSGGSIYFNGTTDYLTAPANTAFTLGTGDFTVEGWVNLTNAAANAYLASMNYEGSGGTGQWALYMTGASAAKQLWFNSSTGNNMASATVNLPANTWTHIAYSRSGTSGRFFVNGIQVGTTLTDSKNYPAATGTFYVGRMSTAANYFPGYISNLRVVKGTAVYTANFTPSTIPLTAIANTSLLLSGTNGAIIDAAGKNDITTVGSVAAQTTVTKYGTSAIKFNGTTDYLTLPLSQAMQLGPADFTCEAWVYLNAIGARQTLAFINGNTSGFAALGINILANGKLSCAMSETGSAWKFEDVTGIGSALSTNTWYHVAVVRNGATITVYLNGASIGTYSLTAAATSLMTTYTLNQIGAYNTSYYFMNGYIDDFRITKGIARYTANFTVPADTFPTH